MSYQVLGFDKVEAFADRVDRERGDAMLVWVQAAMLDPELVTEGQLANVHRRHVAHYSYVRLADAFVVFAVASAPVRALIIIGIIDA